MNGCQYRSGTADNAGRSDAAGHSGNAKPASSAASRESVVTCPSGCHTRASGSHSRISYGDSRISYGVSLERRVRSEPLVPLPLDVGGIPLVS